MSHHSQIGHVCTKLYIVWGILLGSLVPSAISYGVTDVHKHLKLLDNSLYSLTGRGICERMGIPRTNEDEMYSDMYSDIHLNERFVVISHGTEADPIYNYGNAASRQAFSRTWEELCQIPSADSVVRRSVDENLRIELMSKVTRDGYVEGATGIRRTGDDDRYLRLVDAVVWNCYDESNAYYGQAAFFDRQKAEYLTRADANSD